MTGMGTAFFSAIFTGNRGNSYEKSRETYPAQTQAASIRGLPRKRTR